MSRRGRLFAGAGVAIASLAAMSTVAVAAVTGAFDHHHASPVATRCAVPALPGSVVSVRLVDMGRMSGRAPMMGNRRMMRVIAAPASVPHGTVSLQVVNVGSRTHELVVLPLPAGQPPGARAIGTDRTVSEAGSLGEASAPCAAGAGDGLTPGTTGWVTLRLPAGRYELVCNLPGHYAAGMYTELDVT